MEFEFLKKFSRRGFVRLCSFGIVAVLIICGVAVTGFATAERYKSQLEKTYEQNLGQLSNHLNTIQTTLQKGIYASTLSSCTDLAMELWQSAGAAQVCLSNIPLASEPLSNTNKFLSQVGDYSLSLAEKLQNGQSITDDDRYNLKVLAKYARQINTSVDEMNTALNNSGEWKKQIKSVIDNGDKMATTQLSEGFNNLESSFSDFPTLLYDGPFSDHILQAKPLFLEDKTDITSETAYKIACETVNVSLPKTENMVNGTIPCFSFSNDLWTVDITQKGGYCSFFLNSRNVASGNIDGESCSKIALNYANELGLGKFTESYYSINEGVCTVNLAYTENDIVYYTDLVKVGVATDNGEIVSFNAQGYIMNHTNREFDPPAHTANEAQQVLSSYLDVQKIRTAVIPLNTQKERLCYEFLCKGEDDEEILVYVNTQTLQEEKILILLKTDGGTLTV